MKLGSIWVGTSVFKTGGTGALLKERETLEVPLHDKMIRVWCTITATQIVGPIFLKTLLFKGSR
jgi:hypothetical protein